MNKTILAILGLITAGLLIWAGVKYYDRPERDSLNNEDKASERAVVASGHPEWSPIMFREGEEIKGAGPALLKMILDELDIESEFPYKGPWDEVQQKARSGEVDMLVAAYKTDERLTYMDYSEPYTTDPVAVFVKAGSTMKFDKWEHLIGKKGMGTVGDSYGQAFDDFIKSKLNFATASSSAAAFDAVESGAADYFVYSLFAGEREIPAQGRTGKIVNLPKFVAEENFYITISKKSPFVGRMSDINRLIAKYKADGTVDRLIAQFKARQ